MSNKPKPQKCWIKRTEQISYFSDKEKDENNDLYKNFDLIKYKKFIFINQFSGSLIIRGHKHRDALLCSGVHSPTS